MNPITEKINAALAATEPRTKARNKALAAVRWVLVCAQGYATLSAIGFRCVITEDIAKASVFDGRDNEELKARYWSVQLKTPCVPMLLP